MWPTSTPGFAKCDVCSNPARGLSFSSSPRRRIVSCVPAITPTFITCCRESAHLVSGHSSAYTYLPMSVAQFPTGNALADAHAAAGFSRVTWQPLTLGVAAIHVGVVPGMTLTAAANCANSANLVGASDRNFRGAIWFSIFLG